MYYGLKALLLNILNFTITVHTIQDVVKCQTYLSQRPTGCWVSVCGLKHVPPTTVLIHGLQINIFT